MSVRPWVALMATGLASLATVPVNAGERAERRSKGQGHVAQVERFEGRAYTPETRRPLYTEHHRVALMDGRPIRETVTYHQPGGGLFARKTLEYGAQLSAPSFRFEDLRSGRMEQVERRGLNWRVTLRESRGEALERELLRTAPAVIVDEGYRMLLQSRWSRLRQGVAVVSEAIVPSRLSSYDMRFRARGMERRGDQDLLRVSLDMDHLLLRIVGPSADLYFDVKLRRLVEFVGLANIRDVDGDPQQARIVYRY